MADKQDKKLKTLADFQRRFTSYENCNDFSVLPGMKMVVRLDAHRVGPWDDAEGEYPFSKEFHEALVDTAIRLMSGPVVSVASYIHGDEISLLLSNHECSNPRKRSRLLSLLASYAALFCNQRLSAGKVVFHTKLSELPEQNLAADYFVWQRLVAVRNSVNYFVKKICAGDAKAEKEFGQNMNALSLFDRVEYLADLGVKYWGENPIIHSGTFLTMAEFDEASEICCFKGLEGERGMDVDELRESFEELIDFGFEHPPLLQDDSSLLGKEFVPYPSLEQIAASESAPPEKERPAASSKPKKYPTKKAKTKSSKRPLANKSSGFEQTLARSRKANLTVVPAKPKPKP